MTSYDFRNKKSYVQTWFPHKPSFCGKREMRFKNYFIATDSKSFINTSIVVCNFWSITRQTRHKLKTFNGKQHKLSSVFIIVNGHLSLKRSIRARCKGSLKSLFKQINLNLECFVLLKRRSAKDLFFSINMNRLPMSTWDSVVCYLFYRDMSTQQLKLFGYQ